MAKKKIDVKPVGSVSSGSFKPNKDVDVKSTHGYYGIKGKYNFDKGSVSAQISKDFSRGKVDFPGGSEKFKFEGKPRVDITVEKKFGGPDPKKDLSKFVDEKNKGGAVAIGCGRIMKDRKKKTKRY